MRGLRLLAILLWVTPVAAETVVALRTIPAQSILHLDDLGLAAVDVPGAVTHPRDAEGLETRVTLYAGRPVRRGDLQAPALVERNQIVSIVYLRGNLRIAAEGRALGRGGAGDRLRVMNLTSRNTLFGVVSEDGTIHVNQ